jgi:hypothetical protein
MPNTSTVKFINTFLLFHITWHEKCCDREKSIWEFDCFTRFKLQLNTGSGFWYAGSTSIRVYVMCVYMYLPRIAPERLQRFYLYSSFKTSSVMGLCPIIVSILALKIGPFHRSPQRENGDFLEKWRNDFDKISAVYWRSLPKQNCIVAIFRKILELPLCQKECDVFTPIFLLLSSNESAFFGTQPVNGPLCQSMMADERS